jgi:hypothetical protein
MRALTLQILRQNIPDRRMQCVLLSALGVCHFSFAIFLWIGIAQLFTRGYLVAHALPAFVFWSIFLMALVLSIKRHQLAAVLLIAGIVLALAGFLFDTHFGRFQLQFWEEGAGWTDRYATWWWWIKPSV